MSFSDMNGDINENIPIELFYEKYKNIDIKQLLFNYYISHLSWNNLCDCWRDVLEQKETLLKNINNEKDDVFKKAIKLVEKLDNVYYNQRNDTDDEYEYEFHETLHTSDLSGVFNCHRKLRDLLISKYGLKNELLTGSCHEWKNHEGNYDLTYDDKIKI